VLRPAMVQVKPQRQRGQCRPNRGNFRRTERQQFILRPPAAQTSQHKILIGNVGHRAAYRPPLRKASLRKRAENSRNRRS